MRPVSRVVVVGYRIQVQNSVQKSAIRSNRILKRFGIPARTIALLSKLT